MSMTPSVHSGQGYFYVCLFIYMCIYLSRKLGPDPREGEFQNALLVQRSTALDPSAAKFVAKSDSFDVRINRATQALPAYIFWSA